MKSIHFWISLLALFIGLAGCGGGPDSESGTPLFRLPVAAAPTVANPSNVVPIASAGPDQNVAPGSVVTLDGSASSDGDGDSLTYLWALTKKPFDSAATLAEPASAHPTFTPDVAGTYVAMLLVSDGKVTSSPMSVTVFANSPPVANAGSNLNVVTGSAVTLDGSVSSDANGDPLTYAWTLTSKPAGSTATLAGGTTPRPTFTADAAGSYIASLVVNDGKVNSAPAGIIVTATTAPPVGVTFYLYGGSSSNIYLGCLNCSAVLPDSVCNPTGDYGFRFATNSIWYAFGPFGSRFEDFSPWNRIGFSPPVVRGSDGLNYGYFSINTAVPGRTTIASLRNTLDFFSSTQDLVATRDNFCGP